MLPDTPPGMQPGFLNAPDSGAGGGGTESLKAIMATIQRTEAGSKDLAKLAGHLKGREGWLERTPGAAALASALGSLNPAVHTLGCLYLL